MNYAFSINQNDIKLEHSIKRFIEYTDSNFFNKPFDKDEGISIKKLKEEEALRDDVIRYIDVNICDSIINIISYKVKIVTMVDIINDEDSKFTFEDIYKVFKEVVAQCEMSFKERGENLFDHEDFLVVDVITTRAAIAIASKIIREFKLPKIESSE